MPKLKPDVVQCNSCGGVYRTLLDDGTLYFHACPTTRVVTPSKHDPATGDLLEAAVIEPTLNRRDENVGGVDAEGKAIVKSEGLGVTRVDDAAIRASFGVA